MKKQALLGLTLFTISPIAYGMGNASTAGGAPPSITVVTATPRARSASFSHSKHSNSVVNTVESLFHHQHSSENTAGHKQGAQPTAAASGTAQPTHAQSSGIGTQPTVNQPANTSAVISVPAKKSNQTLLAIIWNMIWGKKPEITHHPYHKHYHDNPKVNNFVDALRHQGKLVRNAYKYQIKRSSSLAAVAATITAAVAYPSYGASASTIALGAGAALATGAISWFYHGRRAQLNEIADRHKAVVLHAIRADLTAQEAAMAYNQVVRAGYWHSLFKFWPVGIADMSSIRDEVQDNARILERDRLRTERTHTIVPQAATPTPQSTNP